MKLSRRDEDTALRFLDRGPMSVQLLAGTMGISYAAARERVKRLRAKGLLVQVGTEIEGRTVRRKVWGMRQKGDSE